MMDDRNALFSEQTFARAVEFVWREAEMLDRRDYRAWLDLWDPAGHYVVPIDPDTTDFAATLNYVFDGTCAKRVQRMVSGYSASATDAARTVRTVSRFTLESGSADTVELKSAQVVVAYKRGVATLFAADVTQAARRCGRRDSDRREGRAPDRFDRSAQRDRLPAVSGHRFAVANATVSRSPSPVSAPGSPVADATVSRPPSPLSGHRFARRRRNGEPVTFTFPDDHAHTRSFPAGRP